VPNCIKIIIIMVIFLSSCGSSNNIKQDDVLNNRSKIELFSDDYNVIVYDILEYEYLQGKGDPIRIKLLIINSEKLNILLESFFPLVYIFIDDKKYVAEGIYELSSLSEKKCDYYFQLDNNGKIILEDNNIIFFKRKRMPVVFNKLTNTMATN